ncbi:hypothetical protein D3C78_1590840 [compost metagenome]
MLLAGVVNAEQGFVTHELPLEEKACAVAGRLAAAFVISPIGESPDVVVMRNYLIEASIRSDIRHEAFWQGVNWAFDDMELIHTKAFVEPRPTDPTEAALFSERVASLIQGRCMQRVGEPYGYPYPVY